MAVDPELSAFYEQLYGRPLAKPANEQDVKNILSCIRVGHSDLDSEDNEQLERAGLDIVRKKMTMVASKSRKVLAQFTKTISDQLYDDPFRFFYELIQNADDAKYGDSVTPTITFTVSKTDLIVDLNEEGFSLIDVQSICSTGQSSKSLDPNSTGAKGFGFKSVFGIADQVHIRSGLWSFRFEHRRQDDGIGMISPIWEPGEQLEGNVGTRFRLRLSFGDTDGLEDLCAQLRSVHPSVIFALRRIEKLSIRFDMAEATDGTVSFHKSVSKDRIMTIESRECTEGTEGTKVKEYYYRICHGELFDMPRQIERTKTTSVFTIGLPITDLDDGHPLLSATGQFVFAFLPIVQMMQLPFLIHADFLLTGSRQAILDNAWNRRLRAGLAFRFNTLVKQLVLENSNLSYEWPAYVPLETMIGFWQDFPGSIQRALREEEIFFSRSLSLHKPRLLRILTPNFTYRSTPLLSDSNQAWYFLSERYKPSYHQAVTELGASRLNFNEALDIVDDDLKERKPRLHTRLLQDAWHDKFLTFISTALSSADARYKRRIQAMSIMPVRVNNMLEWYQPGQGIYFSSAVNEGVGPGCVQIEMPTDVDIVVLHPIAEAAISRQEVYSALGVQHASSAQICAAVTRALAKPGTKTTGDLRQSLELLFWFSYQPNLIFHDGFKAATSGGTYRLTKELFMRSDQEYHAERLVRLDENPQYSKDFLNNTYQSSVVAARSRGGKTWEQWLCEVAGVRWYPPLQDLHREKLHWIFDVVLSRKSTEFLSLIQTYWAQEYSGTFRFNEKVGEALRKSKVHCQHGGVEELQHTWFPTRNILDKAKKYGVEDDLPILSLPHAPGDHLISEWSSLRDLGIRYTLDLSFYRETLSLLSATTQRPRVGVRGLDQLYKNMASKMTLDDREAIQADFENCSLIWDPTCKVWRTLEQCVWDSDIDLQCRFVITSEYDEDTVWGLFGLQLQTADVTIECLVDELEYFRDSRGSETDAQVLANATEVYDYLSRMADTVERKQIVKSFFKDKDLIYSLRDNEWIKSKSCVWHSTVNVSNYVPIAAMYLNMQPFFVGTLGVNTVTPVFMMKQLASAAKSRSKTIENIKTLMLAVSELLDASSNASDFKKSMEILDECDYLPCRSTAGATEFRSRSQSFFIIDNETYAGEFGDRLVMLDFTYEQLNSLHYLIQLLGLDDHYLARHVKSETSPGDSTEDDILTVQFRQCAYAISCCAIAHRSPLFSNQSRVLYDSLANATIHTSSTMSSYLKVVQDGHEIKVPTARPSLIAKHDHNMLKITLPAELSARKQCMRSQLPGYIAEELLDVIDSRGEKQIYRILNELESGTDDVLLEEGISRVSWLPEIRRPAPAFPAENAPPSPHMALQTSGLANEEQNGLSGLYQTQAELPIDDIPRQAVAAFPTTYREPYRVLPAEIQHEIDAPNYWKVIEHVHRQASKIGSRLHHRNDRAGSLDDLTAGFATLALDNDMLDPADHPGMFGSDWLSTYRLGAAGELFVSQVLAVSGTKYIVNKVRQVFEILKHLLGEQFDLPNWQSKIRHLVQAHRSYTGVHRRTAPETADIVFCDRNNDLELQLSRSRHIVSDIFEDWYPPWYHDSDRPLQQPLEWLFEVKATIGPCENELLMSPKQYNLMRKLGTQDNSARKQVYCLVRVYNLLSDKIGIRFYIDPWRFREGRLEFGTTEKWKVKPVELA
ncbi:hypothetical protein H2200_010015 [Cladophialophora chaetospira]|uniref:Uncharacterized protein n=1 Tax=Cladophialophora chaetospira TaxID=386627 RepID=A0AA38X209_9EURO|nr:hypothetical protein H2200_010015 [Cladophialophora chaetospira]